MSLATGQNIKWYSWDDTPMHDTVIDRVNILGKNQP